MMSHQLQLRMPDPIFRRLQARAAHRNRSVEEELIELAARAASDEDTLPNEQEQRLEAMNALTDEELWSAIRQHLPAALARALAQLNQKRAATGLTEAEARRQVRLIEQCEWNMLLRAQAARLLTERGYDVTELFQP